MRLLAVAALLICAAPLSATPLAGEPLAGETLEEPRLRFTLSGTLVTGQSITDWAFLRFLPDAEVGWDRHDASKYSVAPAQIAFAGRRDRQRVRLGMNSLPDGSAAPLRRSFNTKLQMTTDVEGTFTLTWDGALADGWRATLVDRGTGTVVKMWRASSYTFRMKPAEWTDRFFVRIRPAADAATLAPEPPAPEATLTTSTLGVGQLYPNPASGAAAQLPLSLGAEQAVRVAIYNALGREVAVAHDGPLAEGTRAIRLSTSALPPGTYLVRIAGEGLAETRRLTVAR
ncbi:MAG: T9SS type A sorting domain-containing protein [Bacteroidota bacterium]